MTSKAKGWNEQHLAENPAIELLESFEYVYIPPEDLERERSSYKDVILTGQLETSLERLNPWLSETNVVRAVKAVTQVAAASLAEANEALYTSLTYGIGSRAGPKRWAEEPDGAIHRLREPGSKRLGRDPTVQGTGLEEAHHP